MTAVEWLVEQFFSTTGELQVEEIIQQAKKMEIEQSKKYAEFSISCDRQNMKILNFDDWIKL
jgi:hypothetical protein